MSSRKAGSAPVYATASTVIATAASGRSAGARATRAQVSTPISHTAAAYGQATDTSARTSAATIVA